MTHANHLAMHHDPQAAAIAFKAFEDRHTKEVEAIQRHRNYAWATGRILLGLMFLGSAVAKAIDFSAMATAMDDYGLRGAPILLTLAIAIEGISGVMLAVGTRTRGAAVLLAVWLATVTAVMNGNLAEAGNRAAALSNFAIIAACLFMYAHGAGRFSLDHHRAKNPSARKPGLLKQLRTLFDFR